MRRLEALGIPYDVVPGVPAFAATAARLKTELTLPEIAQTIIITRTEMKASAMPEFETLEILGKSRATLAIHLSIRNLPHIREVLTPYYGEDCPVIIAYRATWPDEQFIRTTLKDMQAAVREAKITRTALIMVGMVFGHVEFRDSDLYNSQFSHVLRNVGKKKKKAAAQ
jgi:precorrin-4/cobalt-precorrin-4 C11-methyltransferase